MTVRGVLFDVCKCGQSWKPQFIVDELCPDCRSVWPRGDRMWGR